MDIANKKALVFGGTSGIGLSTCEQLIEKNMDRLDEYFIEFESLLKDSVKERLQKVISSQE